MANEKNAVETTNEEVKAKPTYEELETKVEELTAQLQDLGGRYNRLFKLYANNLDLFLAGDKKQ